jgi:hypothetical protein
MTGMNSNDNLLLGVITLRGGLFLLNQCAVNDMVVNEGFDYAGQAHFQMPTSEMIDASWERVSRILDARRTRDTATGVYPGSAKTALHSLDTDVMISLYGDAVASGVSDDFLRLIEEILLEREVNDRTAYAI